MIFTGKGQVATLPNKEGKAGRIKSGEEIDFREDDEKPDHRMNLVSKSTFDYLGKSGQIKEGNIEDLRAENDRLKKQVLKNQVEANGNQSAKKRGRPAKDKTPDVDPEVDPEVDPDENQEGEHSHAHTHDEGGKK